MDRIVLIGDMLPDAEGIRFDSRIIEICKNAAAVLLNLEGAITDRPAVNKKKYGLLAHKHIIKQLKALCVSCVLLGNNHIMDAGGKGLADTIAVLQDNGISFAGVGMAGDKIYNELPFKTPKGEEYVIFSYSHREGMMFNGSTPGPLALPTGRILEDKIAEHKRLCRGIIFSYHGGEEYFSVPWPRRRGFFHRLNDSGSDIVFGHHAHAIQPFEIRNQRPIIYSPGNFYLDTPQQRRYKGTDRGFIVEISLESKKGTDKKYQEKGDRQEKKEKKGTGKKSMNISLDGESYIRIHQIRADRLDKRVIIETSRYYSLNEDIPLAENDYVDTWVKECRFFFTGGMKKETKTNRENFAIRWLKKEYRKFMLVKNLSKVPRKSRNLDILFSSLFFGKIYAHSLYKAGRRAFDF